MWGEAARGGENKEIRADAVRYNREGRGEAACDAQPFSRGGDRRKQHFHPRAIIDPRRIGIPRRVPAHKDRACATHGAQTQQCTERACTVRGVHCA